MSSYSETEIEVTRPHAAPLTYLACPYSHANPKVSHLRFVACTKAAAWLIKAYAWNVFSPITHSHPLHDIAGLQGDWNFWKQIDTQYIELSCRLVVLVIPGWKESTGVQAEIKIAKDRGLQIFYLNVYGDDYSLDDKPNELNYACHYC